MVKHRHGLPDLLVDPFHSGRVLTEADCQERLDRIFEGRMKMEPRMLEAVSKPPHPGAHAPEPEGPLRQGRTITRAPCASSSSCSASTPESLEDLRDRGLVYAALDCYAFAVRDLTAYLSRVGGQTRTRELEATLDSLRRRAARLN